MLRIVFYLAAPIPIGMLILVILDFLLHLWNDNWPDILWTIVVSTGLVAFLYSWYKCWKLALRELMKELNGG